MLVELEIRLSMIMLLVLYLQLNITNIYIVNGGISKTRHLISDLITTSSTSGHS